MLSLEVVVISLVVITGNRYTIAINSSPGMRMLAWKTIYLSLSWICLLFKLYRWNKLFNVGNFFIFVGVSKTRKMMSIQTNGVKGSCAHYHASIKITHTTTRRTLLNEDVSWWSLWRFTTTRFDRQPRTFPAGKNGTYNDLQPLFFKISLLFQIGQNTLLLYIS